MVGIPVACKVPRGWSELVLSGLEEGSEGAEGLRGMFTWLRFVSEAEEEGSEMSVMVCLWDRGADVFFNLGLCYGMERG